MERFFLYLFTIEHNIRQINLVEGDNTLFSCFILDDT